MITGFGAGIVAIVFWHEWPMVVDWLLHALAVAVLVTWALRERAQRAAAERDLAASELRHQALFHQPFLAMARYRPDGGFESCNEAFERLWGLYEGFEPGSLSYNVLEDPQLGKIGLISRIRSAFAGRTEILPASLYDPRESETLSAVTSEPLWVRGAAFPTLSPEGSVRDVTVVLEDVSEFKRAEEETRLLAVHDGLTGLPNRLLLADRLTMAIAQARRSGERIGIIFLDIDSFKHINDSLGHSAGDELLCTVAGRLTGSVREQDTVARPGGDEFIVVAPGLTHAHQAVPLARKILDRLAEPLLLHGHELNLTASIGISVFPDDGEDPETVIRHADLAMYRSKERGKNRIEVFTSDLDSRNRRRLSLEGQLRKGLERGELCVYYQPRLDILSGRVVAVEALLRWRPSENELRLPSEFLDVAEDSGLIVPMGQEMIAAACAQLGRWHQMGHRWLALAIDLSARQIRDASLVSFIRLQLEAAGVSPTHLEIELAEPALMSLSGSATSVIAALGELGARISLDEFGAGRSLMGNLKKLPISALKLDQSIVAGLPRSREDAAIARATICLARSVGLSAIAEGVMSSEQLDFLGSVGCQQMQGSLLCPPLPPEHLDGFLGAVHTTHRRTLTQRPCLGWVGACTPVTRELDRDGRSS